LQARDLSSRLKHLGKATIEEWFSTGQEKGSNAERLAIADRAQDGRKG
jgi:hypothetical protein